MNATPPKFGTAPVEEGDEFFILRSLICVDCKQVFEASRHSLRCATCRSLRQGQVGPATVTCLVCDEEHQVPVLAPHRLCPTCAADLDATERHIRETLETAEQALTDAWEHWDADLAHSDDKERYAKVCAARVEGAAGFAEKYARALAKGDGLSALLKQSEAVAALITATERTRAWAERALEEVEAAR